MMKYYIIKVFLLFIFCSFLYGNTFSSDLRGKSKKTMVVIIDPGHGGKDPGAIGYGIREKDVVLGIGLKLGRLMNENYPEVNVIFTRNTDVFVPLIDRSKIANKSKADLFISIHANSGGTPSTTGTETFVLGLHRSKENLEVAKKENSVILLEEDYSKTYEGFDPNSSESYIMFELVQDIYMDQSLSFADAIQHQFKSRLSTSNRGVKQAGLLVLRQSSMPSVLVETGFLSNQAEANYLSTEEGQRTIALSIFEAFKKFKAKNEGIPAAIAEKNQYSTDNLHNLKTPKNTEPERVLQPQDTVNPEKAAATEQKPTEAEKTELPQEVLQTTKSVIADIEIQGTTYYSVQIGANTIPIEPVAGNFKGLKDVRREKTDKYYRYYIGKETSIKKIRETWQQIKVKFPQSFIVSFVDGKRIIIDNSK